MKSLLLPVVFAFRFVTRFARTKAVPIGKHHHLAGLKTMLAMAVRSLSAKADTLLISILFCTLGWKQIRYFLSCSYWIRFALPKERKSRNGFRIHWSNPSRFNSCRPYQIKTKASDIRKNRSFFICT